MTCNNCKIEIYALPHYRVIRNEQEWVFCGRMCLIETMAPEIRKVVVPNQWVPTEEETERMSQ